MADKTTNPLGNIVLKSQDIQAIVAGLAANPDIMTTMTHLITPPPPSPMMTSSQETPLSSAAPSSTSQATSSSKLASHSFQLYLYTSPLAHARVKHRYRRENSKETCGP